MMATQNKFLNISSHIVEHLEGPAIRGSLACDREPYWQPLTEKCHLGYFKSESSRIWIARCIVARNDIRDQVIGDVDDSVAADGLRIMNFHQASQGARNWYHQQMIAEAAKPIDDKPFNWIGPACGRT
jgi:hypothetical protein